MTIYQYTALDAQGIQQSGSIEADGPPAAARLLRGRGLFVATLRDGAHDPALSGRDVLMRLRELLPVKIYELVFFFQQMALMLRSGLPILEALDTAQAITRSARLSAAIRRLSLAVRSGERLSEAMAREQAVFPPLAVQLLKSAEASGEMDLILERIAEDLDRKADLKRNLLTALMYPSIVVLAAVGVSAFLVMGIIPKMAKFLERKGNALPSATRNLLDLSHFFEQWGLVLVAGFVVAAVAIVFCYSRPRGRLLIDRILLSLPKVGYSLQTASVTQLSWSLAILLKSGVTVLESLKIVAQLIPNKAIAAVVEATQAHILAGRDVASGLQSPLLPRLVPQMIAIGERTGTLDRVMRELGNYYQRELALQIKRLTAMIEPALTLLIGGMVGYVYYAFFQALFGMTG
ncbi:MAG TPA: type II secretion system F family protein [Methylococcaceae bacterium]|nr:type II secretion system F family protein [Methylococcaceae bacterium]